MSGSLNKVMIIGNLGADPDVRDMPSGDQCVSFSIATSDKWIEKETGEKKERTEWHRGVIFDPNLVKVAKEYLSKGTKVYIEGQLQTREYTDNEGNRRYMTEITLQRFSSKLILLGDSKRNAPPAVDSADGYGTVSTSVQEDSSEVQV